MSEEHPILSPEEQMRYARHIVIPELGLIGQEKLRQARVLVVGCGGLGCPLLQYLVAAGVGSIGIADDDVVSLSNLQRQILFTTAQVGQQKVEAAAERLKALNPEVQLHLYPFRLNAGNIGEVIAAYDIVCDGTDNFTTRYLVNDACVLWNKVNVFAAVNRFEGQVAVFNHQRKVNYRHLFPVPPQAGEVQDCATAGVLGAMCGVVATYQALQVIQLITGIGTILDGQLMTMDALTMRQTVFTIPYQENIVIQELREVEQSCAAGIESDEIEAETLHHWIQNPEPVQLIDVREAWEFEEYNIGGLCIPIAELNTRLKDLDPEIPKVLMCQTGGRSAAALAFVKKSGIQQVYHLKGGLAAYRAIQHTAGLSADSHQ